MNAQDRIDVINDYLSATKALTDCALQPRVDLLTFERLVAARDAAEARYREVYVQH
jgi:hypothetical protein